MTRQIIRGTYLGAIAIAKLVELVVLNKCLEKELKQFLDKQYAKQMK